MTFKAAPDAIVAGRYRLVRRLGSGGMASVWLAHHQDLGTDVAVKLMAAGLDETPQARARFEREAKASAMLRSVHLTRVTDYGLFDGTPFMVQELLIGEDLGARLAREERLPDADLVRIAKQICKGLGVAHDAGIVHRDIKPTNIFLTVEGREEIAKVLDFGVAKEVGKSLVDDQTSSGTLVGSPLHMSPEQALGEPVDHRSDLWSLAIVLFRGLTGKRPFERDNITALLLAIATEPIPAPSSIIPELSKDVDRFFARALHRDLSRRFQDAASFAEAFDAAMTGQFDHWLRRQEGAPMGDATEDQAPAAPAVSRLRAAAPAPEEETLEKAVATGVTAPTPKGARRMSIAVVPVALVALLIGLGYVVFRVRFERSSDWREPARAMTPHNSAGSEQVNPPLAADVGRSAASATAAPASTPPPPEVTVGVAPPVKPPGAPLPKPLPKGAPPSSGSTAPPPPDPKRDDFTGILLDP